LKSTGVGPYAVYGGKPYVPDGIHAACINVEFYRLFEGNQEPDKLRYQTRHVPNLFELPVLFYAGCIVAFVTGTVDTLLVGTAWLFVLTRYVHSYFHITSNVVFYRAWSFVAGFVVIVFMWLVLSIRLISLGSAIT
jgi:hypothetical protein